MPHPKTSFVRRSSCQITLATLTRLGGTNCYKLEVRDVLTAATVVGECAAMCLIFEEKELRSLHTFIFSTVL